MIGILVTLLILAVVIYVVNLIIGELALPPVVKTIVYLVAGLIGLLYLLSVLGLYTIPLR